MTIDFDRDVLPLSNYAMGGTVTERHLASALACRMLEVVGCGEKLVAFIKNELQLPLSAKVEGYLLDERQSPSPCTTCSAGSRATSSPGSTSTPPTSCPTVREALDLCERDRRHLRLRPIWATWATAVTGDKRAQKFEDDYPGRADPLYQAELGFRAVTYMPSRNTRAQLDPPARAVRKARPVPDQRRGHQLPAPVLRLRGPARSRLPPTSYEATWALIAHEWRSTESIRHNGLFSEKSIRRWPNLNDRVRAFAEFGLAMQKK